MPVQVPDEIAAPLRALRVATPAVTAQGDGSLTAARPATQSPGVRQEFAQLAPKKLTGLLG